MKKGLFILACLCFIFLLILSFAIEKSHIMEKHLAYDISDQAQVEKEAAYAQTLDVAGLVKYFKALSDNAGAAYAYEILRRLPPSSLDPYKHLFGHIIGDELFKQQNLGGLDVCTPEFTFACYHSLISRAIAEQGLGNIDKINQKCLELKDVGDCQHGIGHGVMASIGNDDPVAAVGVCDSLVKSPGVTRSCIEGVIMEFNIRQLEQITPGASRQVDERGYYYPCTQMPDRDKSECFFEQTIWWRELLGKSNYPAIGALCDGIENEENKAWCYRGIGRLIPEYSEDPVDVMAAQCIGSTSVIEGQALCLQMLRDKTKNDGSICGLLSGTYADVCRSPVPELVIQ